jgi:hypothetical protein
LEAQVSKHDREIAAIRKLILQGMKMINALAVSQRQHDAHLLRMEGDLEATRKEMRELAASQRKTEVTLERFIRSMEKGSNGRNGHDKQS